MENKSYWKFIDSLISDAKKIKDTEKREDYVNEQILGSEWIIYNHKAAAVLATSDNYEYGFDTLDTDLMVGCKSCGELLQRMAYWAALRDVEEGLRKKG